MWIFLNLLDVDAHGASPPLSSSDSDFSTGYLEDALLVHSQRSKRRRLLFYSDDAHHQTQISNQPLAESYSSENYHWKLPQNCITSIHGISDEILSNTSEEANANSEMKAHEEQTSAPENLNSSSSLNFTKSKCFFHEKNFHHPGVENRQRRMITKIAYPFALVKAGRVEGDNHITLNDINESILKPPTRPIRHPVGKFAHRRWRPPCMSAIETKFSGKTVVALTRIRTHGKGIITIIRTKD